MISNHKVITQECVILKGTTNFWSSTVRYSSQERYLDNDVMTQCHCWSRGVRTHRLTGGISVGFTLTLKPQLYQEVYSTLSFLGANKIAKNLLLKGYRQSIGSTSKVNAVVDRFIS